MELSVKLKTLRILSILLILGCASARDRGPAMPVGGDDGDGGPSGESAVYLTALPVGAFELLAESAADSCAVCARELKTKAFVILDDHLRPGAIVETDSLRHFVRTDGGENELSLTSHSGNDPRLTFRFHTAENHLVGIAESDWTDESIAERFRSFPSGAAFHGALEIVEFTYGDGPTYLSFAPTNHLQVHCRIMEIAGE
jgi:hypothetical protein